VSLPKRWLRRAPCPAGEIVRRHEFRCARLALSFSALGEPAAHCFRQAFRIDSKARLQKAVGNRKCVIELGLAGEVVHTKIVKPIERTGTAVSAYNDVDAQLLSEYEVSIARTHGDAYDAANSLPLPNQRTRIELV
jgi:hypothetical protein